MLIKLPAARRDPERPVIEPRTDPQYWWESKGVFNPAATEYQGDVILLYRAYDIFRISRLGLARSGDGINFQLSDWPAVDTDPDDPYERLGLEDPRITKIGKTYYIVHTSASYYPVGRGSDLDNAEEKSLVPWRIRIGMRTTEDFISYKNFGVILPEAPAKNASLWPEKINGDFALLYRQNNGLKLALTPDFKRWHGNLEIKWPEAAEWQSLKFGTGSQPILTEQGCLMVYHAVDRKMVYRLGLMMFDRQDPTRILWYSQPILEPTTPYEKVGYVANVVYTCGAIVRGKELWIYYGAADRVIGRAIWNLADLPAA